MRLGVQIYVNKSGKAIEFYKKAFNAKVRGEIHWQPEFEGVVIVHAELDVFGNTLAIADLDFGSGEVDKKSFRIPVTGNIMQICLSSLSNENVHEIYEVLKEGALLHNPPREVDWGQSGFTECCFGLVDKYGVRWHIST